MPGAVLDLECAVVNGGESLLPGACSPAGENCRSTLAQSGVCQEIGL